MELIELHILQSFPVTCLNRDDLGAPKSAVFGGVQRARVSSQSWKRAIRFQAKELQPGLFAGSRTRFVVRDFQRLYEQKEFGTDEARVLAESTADAIGKLDDKNPNKVKTLLYVSPLEMDNVVDEAAKLGVGETVGPVVRARHALEEAQGDKKPDKELKKLTKEYDKQRKALDQLTTNASKKLKDAVKDRADISIFGRMVADDHTMMVEGAGLFSHALSTHKASNEVEFFSAVDDHAEPGDEGAGHIGTLEYSSACYYRYVGLNLDLLRDEEHLGHLETEELKKVLDAFLRSAILAVPEARKNSMFGYTAPDYILGLRRRGQPLSLVNAFEKPVGPGRGGGYLEDSKKKLIEHFESIDKTYALNPAVKTDLPTKNLASLVEALLAEES